MRNQNRTWTKNKLKINQLISPVQSDQPVRQSRGTSSLLWQERFVRKVGLEPQLKNEGVVDAESGDNVKDKLPNAWGSESWQDWWADKMNLEVFFQWWADAYLNERSLIFNEETVDGRKRVTTDKERILWLLTLFYFYFVLLLLLFSLSLQAWSILYTFWYPLVCHWGFLNCLLSPNALMCCLWV